VIAGNVKILQRDMTAICKKLTARLRCSLQRGNNYYEGIRYAAGKLLHT